MRDKPVAGLGWCLSTAGGGPQFGQPRDPWMHKVRVENFFAENNGDDSLGFFNVKVRTRVISVHTVCSGADEQYCEERGDQGRVRPQRPALPLPAGEAIRS